MLDEIKKAKLARKKSLAERETKRKRIISGAHRFGAPGHKIKSEHKWQEAREIERERPPDGFELLHVDPGASKDDRHWRICQRLANIWMEKHAISGVLTSAPTLRFLEPLWKNCSQSEIIRLREKAIAHINFTMGLGWKIRDAHGEKEHSDAITARGSGEQIADLLNKGW